MHQEIDPTARWDVRHHDELLENVRLEERRIAGRLMLACITERDVVAYLTTGEAWPEPARPRCAHCATETQITLHGHPCCLDCLELHLARRPTKSPRTTTKKS